MNKEIQIKFKIAVILQRPENSLLDQSQKLTDIYEVFKEELILSGVVNNDDDEGWIYCPNCGRVKEDS